MAAPGVDYRICDIRAGGRSVFTSRFGTDALQILICLILSDESNLDSNRFFLRLGWHYPVAVPFFLWEVVLIRNLQSSGWFRFLYFDFFVIWLIIIFRVQQELILTTSFSFPQHLQLSLLSLHYVSIELTFTQTELIQSVLVI